MRKLAVVAGVVVLALAGCGGDDEDGGTASAPGAAPTAGVEQATQSIQRLAKAPTDIGVTEPLAKSAKGKKVVYLRCDAPICGRIADSVEEAAAALGIELQQINAGSSPAEIAGAMQRAVEARPAAVIDPAMPPALFRKELAELKQQGVPVFGINVDDTPDFGLAGYLFGSPDRQVSGSSRADWIAARSNGDAKVLYVTAPEFTSLEKTLGAFRTQLTAVCPKCSMEVVPVKTTDIGRGVPSRVVSYLQAHPDVKYVTFGFGDLIAGVPQAIKGAGLSGISLTTTAGGALNFQEIRSGGQDADLTVHWEPASWQLMDAVARATTGQEFKIPPAPLQWIDKSTATFDPRSEPPFGSDFKAEFRKLWDAAGE